VLANTSSARRTNLLLEEGEFGFVALSAMAFSIAGHGREKQYLCRLYRALSDAVGKETPPEF
jgi:hypothetical protein